MIDSSVDLNVRGSNGPVKDMTTVGLLTQMICLLWGSLYRISHTFKIS